MAMAKQRYLLNLKVTAMVSVLATVIALFVLHYTGSELTLALIVSVIFGVGGTLMLASALIGLVYLSHASGADEEAGREQDRFK